MNVSVDSETAAKVGTMRDWLLQQSGGGDLYLAAITAPVIEHITGGDYQLLKLPDGYARVGTAKHTATAMNTLTATLDRPLPRSSGPQSRFQRALVLSTVADEYGDVYIAAVAPRVRIDAQQDGDLDVVVFAYHEQVTSGGAYGPGTTYAVKLMLGGPGWVARMRECGVAV